MIKKQNNKVLVVVSHPDDEVLGCGGTIAKLAKQGNEVFILFLSDGEGSRNPVNLKENTKNRQKIAQEAGKILGVKEMFFECLPDNQFDSLSLLEVIKIVEKYLLKIKPEIVYTHFVNDLNIDHCLTFKAVLTACRPQPNFFVKKILSFEVLSSTEWQAKNFGKMFRPTVYENITDFIEQKLNALRVYKEELREYPHPRSLKGIEVLAQYRGIESGYKFAETFQLIRDLND